MTSRDVRQKYIDFFKAQGHTEVPSDALVPENDPTTLFTSAGMQPMMAYLLGETHPLGKRLVDSQRCFRSQDIEEVGDDRHDTFFEMLGNWSLGDYFKKEQLTWFFTFLTKELGLDPQRLYVTVFEGNDSFPADDESIEIWKELFKTVGIEAEVGTRIFPYGAKKNWWSRSGPPENMPAGEPGGPDSEVFYDFGEGFHEKSKWADAPCHVNCDCGRYIELGNSVFMQYVKNEDGSFSELPNKNVDFGGGLERIMMAVDDTADIGTIDLFKPLIESIERSSQKEYQDNKASMQIIADHLKAATFLILDGVQPSNKLQGYVLRRLLRRAAVKLRQLKGTLIVDDLAALSVTVLRMYDGIQGASLDKEELVFNTISAEIAKFAQTLEKGLRELEKIETVDGKVAFDFYQSYGFPLELTQELALEKGQDIDTTQFQAEFEKHRDLSRTASAGMFKGGLANHSEQTTKLHTATHLLHQALFDTLGEKISQKGSNITEERLRFDFSHSEKLSEAQLRQVEEIVNQKISENLPVTTETMSKEEALKSGAKAFFAEKYGDQVTVYSVGNYSKEICGGPHVKNSGELGSFKILKEESAGAGIRRIYATVS